GGGGGGNGLLSFLPLILIVAVGYLLLIRPARNRQRKAAQQRAEVLPGVEVTTTAGLIATVVSVEDDIVTLEIAPGVQSRFVAGVLVALYLGLLFGPAQTPRLGLDLRGGTQVILTATPLQGHSVTKGALNQAVNIIRQRVDAAGVGGATTNTQGSTNIVVSAP